MASQGSNRRLIIERRKLEASGKLEVEVGEGAPSVG